MRRKKKKSKERKEEVGWKEYEEFDLLLCNPTIDTFFRTFVKRKLMLVYQIQLDNSELLQLSYVQSC